MINNIISPFVKGGLKGIFKPKWGSNAIQGMSAVFLLNACTSHLPDIHFPSELTFQGKTYQQITDNRLGELRQSLYLPHDSEQNPNDWQQAILLFSDQNRAGTTLAQRLAFRQAHTANSDGRITYHITQHELRSQGIFPPTPHAPYRQLEATRGRNLHCGYGQIQLAQRQKLAKSPIFSPPCQQQLQQLASQLNQLAWQLECR